VPQATLKHLTANGTVFGKKILLIDCFNSLWFRALLAHSRMVSHV
jgi:hypothetical protein